MMRTDRNNNPTAFTTDIARNAGLELGVDYTNGDSFTVNTGAASVTYYTAKLLGDPIDLTLRVIDTIGFRNKTGSPRWVYVDMLPEHWNAFDRGLKIKFIRLMYHHEGGTELEQKFTEALGV